MFNSFFRKSCPLRDSSKIHSRVGHAANEKKLFTLIECWIPKVKNTLPGYVTRIAFLLQQWLYERASMLRYTYIASLVHIATIAL